MKATAPRIDFADVPLFRGVPVDVLDTLGITRKAFDAGETLIDQGDPPKHVLVILSGVVEVKVKAVLLVTRRRHEILGEQAFINDEPHSASCVANGPVEVLCIPADAMPKLLEVPSFVSNLLCDLSKKLRESTGERYERFASQQLLFAEFSSHLSRPLRDELLDRGVDFGAPRRVEDAVILFSDLRGFSQTSAQADPLELAAALSEHFGEMVEIIHDAGGMVDKFVGDAVMAVWGYGGMLRSPNDRILDCAERMVDAARNRMICGSALHVGVGINQGSCFMGNVGTAEKRQFTVIGQTVNLAARFESESKRLGEIVVGSSFRDGLTTERQHEFSEHLAVPLHNSGKHTIFSKNVKGA